MNNRPQFSLTVSFITALFIGFLWFVFGIHSETLDEGYKSSWLRGVFTQNPINDFFIFYLGLIKGLNRLYAMYPQVHWVYKLLQIQLFFSYCIFMGVFYPALIFRNVSRNTALISCCLVLGVFLAPHLVIMTMSRVALISAGLSMFALLLAFNIKLKPNLLFYLTTLLACLVIIIAMLLRFEVVFVTALLFIIFSIFLFSNAGAFLKFWLTLSLLLPLPVLYMHYDQHPDKENFQMVEKLVLQQDDMYINSVYRFSSPEDSMRMIALREWFFVDRNQINKQFVQKYTLSDKSAIFSSLRNWTYKLNFQLPVIKDFIAKYDFLLLWHLLALIALLVLYKENSGIAIPPFLFFVSFWIAMLIIGVVVKFEHRHTAPWTSLGAICLLLIILPSLLRLKTASSLAVILLVLTLGSFVFTMHVLKEYASAKKSEEQYFSRYRSNVLEMAKKNIVVLDLWAMIDYTFTDNCTVISKVPYPRILNYDSGYGNTYEPIRNEWKNLTGGDDAASFYKYLLVRKDSVKIISSPDRIKLMQNYLHVLYNMDVSFAEEPGKDWLKPTAKKGRWIELKVYHLL
jgi:hypothetical protein